MTKWLTYFLVASVNFILAFSYMQLVKNSFQNWLTFFKFTLNSQSLTKQVIHWITVSLLLSHLTYNMTITYWMIHWLTILLPVPLTINFQWLFPTGFHSSCNNLRFAYLLWTNQAGVLSMCEMSFLYIPIGFSPFFYSSDLFLSFHEYYKWSQSTNFKHRLNPIYL